MTETENKTDMKCWYWVATNGASVALSTIPLPETVAVVPTPEQLFGFRTFAEAEEAQRFFLQEPISKIEKYLDQGFRRKLKRGEVTIIKPQNPQPPTTGQTLWLSDGEAADVVAKFMGAAS